MAEVYFAATGPLHWMKQFEQGMEAQVFNIEYTMPNGTRMSQNMGGLMEPKSSSSRVFLYHI